MHTLPLLLALSACTHSHDDHSHDAAAALEAEPVEVHLLQTQIDVMGIEYGGMRSVNLSTAIKANGHLALPPQKKASLSAILGGRVRSILVLEGDYVRKGQTLAWLEHPEFLSAIGEYLEDEARHIDRYIDSVGARTPYRDDGDWS